MIILLAMEESAGFSMGGIIGILILLLIVVWIISIPIRVKSNKHKKIAKKLKNVEATENDFYSVSDDGEIK